jgi:hypothetical protein
MPAHLQSVRFPFQRVQKLLLAAVAFASSSHLFCPSVNSFSRQTVSQIPRRAVLPGDVDRAEDNEEADLQQSLEDPYTQRPKWRRKYRAVLPFEEVRRCIQAAGFDSRAEWDEWVAEGKKSPFLGPYVPSRPDLMYEEEWRGWDDFLGILLDFQEARKVARLIGLKSQLDWYKFVDEDPVRLRALRLPALPMVYYGRAWQGYDDWLGLPDSTIFVPKSWHIDGDKNP